MMQLGRDLIASLNGQNFAVKRSYGGSYIKGTFINREQNQSFPCPYNAASAKIQQLLRGIPGLENVVVVGSMSGFTVDFVSVGARSLISVVSNTLKASGNAAVNVTVTRSQVGDAGTIELQEFDFSDIPESGHMVMQYGTVQPVTILATEMPLTGHDLLRIPEGDRTRERKKIYSADIVFIENPDTKAKADVVTVYGKDYQVESVETWPQYWKAVLVSVEPPEEQD